MLSSLNGLKSATQVSGQAFSDVQGPFWILESEAQSCGGFSKSSLRLLQGSLERFSACVQGL